MGIRSAFAHMSIAITLRRRSTTFQKIAVRSQLRLAVRCEPGSRIVRQNRSASLKPRRRPRRQQRAPYHRHRTLADRPENPGLYRPPDGRGALQTRRYTGPEALSRQRGLHAHHAASEGDQRHSNRRLTNRRASAASAIDGGGDSYQPLVNNFQNFIYNAAQLKDPPKSFDDLLDPKFKGKIQYSTPGQAGDGTAVMLQVILAFSSKDSVFDYLKKLQDNN